MDKEVNQIYELTVPYRSFMSNTRNICAWLIFTNEARIAVALETGALSSGLKMSLAKFQESVSETNQKEEQYTDGILLYFLISEIENYLIDVARIKLKRNPKLIPEMKLNSNHVLLSTKEELLDYCIEDCLSNIMKPKPLVYLQKLTNLLEIDREKLKKFWPVYIEAKARRDIGIHNSWIVNNRYINKIAEVGLPPPEKGNIRLIPDSKYNDSTLASFVGLVDEINEQLLAKCKSN